MVFFHFLFTTLFLPTLTLTVPCPFLRDVQRSVSYFGNCKDMGYMKFIRRRRFHVSDIFSLILRSRYIYTFNLTEFHIFSKSSYIFISKLRHHFKSIPSKSLFSKLKYFENFLVSKFSYTKFLTSMFTTFNVYQNMRCFY